MLLLSKPKIKKNKYIIRFFPVGDKSKGGDAILIELFDEQDNPHIVLIDGGYQSTAESIIGYLKSKYENPVIETMINTHPDLDHISGLKTILESSEIETKKLYFNRPWKDAGLTPQYFKDHRITENSLIERIKNVFCLAEDIEKIALSKNIGISKISKGQNLYKGIIHVLGPSENVYRKFLLDSDKTPDTYFQKYHVPYVHKELEEDDYDSLDGEIEWFYDEDTSEINQTSAVILLNLDKGYLFTGDAGKYALKDSIKYYYMLLNEHRVEKIDTMQLPHHGSRKNINPDLIQNIGATTYIISCPPEGEREGHPSRRLMNKILEINPNAQIYRTGTKTFVFYKGVSLDCTIQEPQKFSIRMDGKYR